jgi:hypothetical protein
VAAEKVAKHILQPLPQIRAALANQGVSIRPRKGFSSGKKKVARHASAEAVCFTERIRDERSLELRRAWSSQ